MTSRAGELARCRSAAGLSEEDCLIWFGVGRSTLERVEAGELVPEAELEQKIDRFLSVAGGGFTLFTSPASCPSTADGHMGAGADVPCGPGVLGGAPIHTNRCAR